LSAERGERELRSYRRPHLVRRHSDTLRVGLPHLDCVGSDRVVPIGERASPNVRPSAGGRPSLPRQGNHPRSVGRRALGRRSARRRAVAAVIKALVSRRGGRCSLLAPESARRRSLRAAKRPQLVHQTVALGAGQARVFCPEAKRPDCPVLGSEYLRRFTSTRSAVRPGHTDGAGQPGVNHSGASRCNRGRLCDRGPRRPDGRRSRHCLPRRHPLFRRRSRTADRRTSSG
jgi:hypothetical protein